MFSKKPCYSSEVALQKCCLKVRFVANLPVEFEEALPPHAKTGLVYLQNYFHHCQHFHDFCVIFSVLTRTIYMPVNVFRKRRLNLSEFNLRFSPFYCISCHLLVFFCQSFAVLISVVVQEML